MEEAEATRLIPLHMRWVPGKRAERQQMAAEGGRQPRVPEDVAPNTEHRALRVFGVPGPWCPRRRSEGTAAGAADVADARGRHRLRRMLAMRAALAAFACSFAPHHPRLPMRQAAAEKGVF